MHAEIGDRVVLHGRHGTRIGVVVEGADGGGSKVRWADGGESILSAPTEGGEQDGHATWSAAKAGPPVSWRRGVTAGVGREASLRQEKLAREAAAKAVAGEPVAGEPVAEVAAAPEQPAEHKPAAGE